MARKNTSLKMSKQLTQLLHRLYTDGFNQGEIAQLASVCPATISRAQRRKRLRPETHTKIVNTIEELTGPTWETKSKRAVAKARNKTALKPTRMPEIMTVKNNITLQVGDTAIQITGSNLSISLTKS